MRRRVAGQRVDDSAGARDRGEGVVGDRHPGAAAGDRDDVLLVERTGAHRDALHAVTVPAPGTRRQHPDAVSVIPDRS